MVRPKKTKGVEVRWLADLDRGNWGEFAQALILGSFEMRPWGSGWAVLKTLRIERYPVGLDGPRVDLDPRPRNVLTGYSTRITKSFASEVEALEALVLRLEARHKQAHEEAERLVERLDVTRARLIRAKVKEGIPS